MRALFFLLSITWAIAVLPARGGQLSAFANFEGLFSKNAFGRVSGGYGTEGFGKASLKFSIPKNGFSARLKITGTLKLDSAIHPYIALYVFEHPKQGAHTAAFSNLAPGVENGYSAKNGTYTITSRSITANAPFVIGTTTGTATLRLLLRKRHRGTQLIVHQTLSTNTLPGLIIWKFQGLRRP